MSRICRFKPDKAAELAFTRALPAAAAAASAEGLPVDTPQGQEILKKIVWATLYHAHTTLYSELGVFTAIGDDSPYFTQFGGQLLGPGQNVVAGAPVANPPQQAAPVQHAPHHVPAQYTPPPVAPAFQPQRPVAPAIVPGGPVPIPPNAVRPGMPLPPLRMPPQQHGAGPGIAQGPGAGQPVPVNAPVMRDGPPSMTEAPAPMPSMLD